MDFNALINNPMMATAAGLLDPRGTYGSFGASLNKGLLAGSQAQFAAQQAAFAKMQMEAMQKKREEEEKQRQRVEQYRQKAQGIVGTPAQYGSPTTGNGFRGGLLHPQQMPTGMYQQNPQMAEMTSGLLNIDPVGTSQALLQSQLDRKPPGPESGIAKLQADLNAGLITPQQYQQGLAVMMKPLVSMGNAPVPPATPMTLAEKEKWGLPPDWVGTIDPKTGMPEQVKGSGQGNTEKLKKWNELYSAGDAVSRYKKLLKQYGTEVWPGEAKLQLGSAYADLMTQAKELANLGVLQGGDFALMEKMMVDPTKVSNQLYSGSEVLSQLEQFEAKIDDAWARAIQLYGLPPGSQRLE